MKESKYLELKNELVDIVHCAFNDWDDYNEECYESHISPQEEVEDFVADAMLHAGYRKQKEGEWILHKPRRENRNATYKCSVCGKLCSSYYNDVGEWKFCPHCGAKMKGE